jgi:hypothetical protein
MRNKKSKETVPNFSYKEGTPINELDRLIITRFLESGNKAGSIEGIVGKGLIPNYMIYKYYSRPEILKLIDEMAEELKANIIQFDYKLVEIVNSNRTSARDKIAAIKLFNEIYKRVKTDVNINITNLTDEQLGDLVTKMLEEKENEGTDIEGVL